MIEKQYRLEENNQTNELFLWKDDEILNVFKSTYDNRKHLNVIVDRLNEQQTTISALKEENEQLRKKNEELQGVNDDLVRWAGEIAKIKLRKELEE